MRTACTPGGIIRKPQTFHFYCMIGPPSWNRVQEIRIRFSSSHTMPQISLCKFCRCNNMILCLATCSSEVQVGVFLLFIIWRLNFLFQIPLLFVLSFHHARQFLFDWVLSKWNRISKIKNANKSKINNIFTDHRTTNYKLQTITNLILLISSKSIQYTHTSLHWMK